MPERLSDYGGQHVNIERNVVHAYQEQSTAKNPAETGWAGSTVGQNPNRRWVAIILRAALQSRTDAAIGRPNYSRDSPTSPCQKNKNIIKIK